MGILKKFVKNKETVDPLIKEYEELMAKRKAEGTKVGEKDVDEVEEEEEETEETPDWAKQGVKRKQDEFQEPISSAKAVKPTINKGQPQAQPLNQARVLIRAISEANQFNILNDKLDYIISKIDEA